MSGHDTPDAAAEPVAHPLARQLIERLAGTGERRVLLLGIGSGRNIPPLLGAGMRVDAIEDDPERALALQRHYAGEPRVRVARSPYAGPYPESRNYAAALSTHALLHGARAAIAAAVSAVRACLTAGAPFFTTLGSTSDPRYRSGRHIEGNTFAPTDGTEAGVPHTYFDELGTRALFAGFTVEGLAEESAAHSAGRWAHSANEAATMVHWVVRARRR